MRLGREREVRGKRIRLTEIPKMLRCNDTRDTGKKTGYSALGVGREGVCFMTVICDQQQITRPKKEAIKDVITSPYSNQNITRMIRLQTPCQF